MADDVAERSGPVRWREVFRGTRGRLTAGLLLLEALVALQSLVVATILPDVKDDLGMVHLYGLVFTAASLATIASIPIAGRAVDRYGARRTLKPVLALFAFGLAVSASAPTMPVMLIGQFLTGAGGGGLYAMSIGTVAKTYPDHMRARVLALMASMWILPGLVGPSLGGLLADTLGWRWAFLAPYPVLFVGWILLVPALDLVPADTTAVRGIPLRWPLQLMVGAGLVFTSVTAAEWWALAPIAAGLAIGLPALARIAPAGTFRVRRGVPAAAAAAFLLSLGFLAVDAFLTLMLRDLRDLSLRAAGAAITFACVTWAAGSAWQSGRADRMPLPRLLRIGSAWTLVGFVAVTAVLWREVPVGVAFAGWALVGFGMGVAFPTIPLAAMRNSARGAESTDVSAVLLLDMLGVAAGAGLGGGVVAVALALDLGLAKGIGGSFVIGSAALLALFAMAGRITAPPSPQPQLAGSVHTRDEPSLEGDR